MALLAEPWADEDKTFELDNIGPNFLVRASLHRQGVMFPSWVAANRSETEGIARIAKAVSCPSFHSIRTISLKCVRQTGAKIIGLPNVIVLHKPSSYTSRDAITIPRKQPSGSLQVNSETQVRRTRLSRRAHLQYRK